MTHPTPMLSFEQVHHRYGEVVALDEFVLQIHPGEIFGLLGPNGAGKTTAIKVATTLLRPTAGRVLLNGRDVFDNPLHTKQLYGLMPDVPFFYGRLSARQFLLFVGHIRELPERELESRIDELLRFFQLDEAAGAAIQGYSLGMKRKLGLATAMLHRPRILILDEPTSGLDPYASKSTRSLLGQLRDQGVTVFLTTHVLQIAEVLCDRVGILDRGRLAAVGCLDELRAQEREDLEDVFLRVTQRRDGKGGLS